MGSTDNASRETNIRVTERSVKSITSIYLRSRHVSGGLQSTRLYFWRFLVVFVAYFKCIINY